MARFELSGVKIVSAKSFDLDAPARVRIARRPLSLLSDLMWIQWKQIFAKRNQSPGRATLSRRLYWLIYFCILSLFFAGATRFRAWGGVLKLYRTVDCLWKYEKVSQYITRNRRGFALFIIGFRMPGNWAVFDEIYRLNMESGLENIFLKICCEIKCDAKIVMSSKIDVSSRN